MLIDLFPDSQHVSSAGFSGETADEVSREFAKLNGFSIVTAGADFLRIAEQRGTPPQIIRLEKTDFRIEWQHEWEADCSYRFFRTSRRAFFTTPGTAANASATSASCWS